MSSKKSTHSSASTKMQQAYWEAKRNIRISLGNRDDDCMISNDSELDTKIEFLQAADSSFDSLMSVLLKYNQLISKLMLAEENLGNALIEYSIRDTTRAGVMMSVCGKAINRGTNRRAPLKNEVMKLYHEVQTFQYKATMDAFLAVAKMEKIRRSYRSGLLWMKNESQTLDPDVSRKMNKFRKVQEHVRNLKIRFDRSKLEVMQKIDLYLFSRCNLFSQTLVQYRKVFCKMSKNYAMLSREASKKTMSCFSFKFQTLKDLNTYSTMPQICLACHMNSMHMSEKTSNMDGDNLTPAIPVKKCDHFPTKQNPNNQFFESGATSISKKERSRLSLKSKSSKKVPEKEMLLVNLDDDEFCDQFDPFPNTISETISNHSDGKYSDDLLLLNLNDSHTGSNSNMVSGSGDFEKESQNCVDFLDSVTPLTPETDSNGLQFWSLMEDYKKQNYSPSISPSGKNPISIDTSKQSSALNKWEDVLIEFDPFTDNNNSKTINDQEC